MWPLVRGQRRYTILLVGLGGLIVTPAFLGSPAAESLPFRILFLAVLLAACWAVFPRPRVRAACLILAVVAAICQWPPLTDAAVLPLWLTRLAPVAFLICVALVILGDVMRAPRVSSDTIHGAICVYLLIALAWGLSYAWLREMDPTAFRSAADDGLDQMIYFSFVTLTTLGFGDITPLSPAARALTWLEAVIGQIYLVVLVAQLVSLHVAGRAHAGPPPPVP